MIQQASPSAVRVTLWARGETTFLIAEVRLAERCSSRTDGVSGYSEVLDERIAVKIAPAIRKVVSPRALWSAEKVRAFR
jgi:hypothetical protein